MTTTASVGAELSVSAKVRESPSAAVAAEAIREYVGAAGAVTATSSLVMVPTAVTEELRRVPEKVTLKVSAVSTAESSVVWIVTNFVD